MDYIIFRNVVCALAILDLGFKNTLQYPMDMNSGNPIQISNQKQNYLILFFTVVEFYEVCAFLCLPSWIWCLEWNLAIQWGSEMEAASKITTKGGITLLYVQLKEFSWIWCFRWRPSWIAQKAQLFFLCVWFHGFGLKRLQSNFPEKFSFLHFFWGYS